jgi:hypothetical protein
MSGNHRNWRPTMAEHLSSAASVVAPVHAAVTATPGLGTTRAVLGVVTARHQDSLTVHVRRGSLPDGSVAERLVTYRVAGTGTRVYKGGRRTTLDEIAVGDLVLVHILALNGDRHAAPVTAARIHGLTPSRRALGA